MASSNNYWTFFLGFRPLCHQSKLRWGVSRSKTWKPPTCSICQEVGGFLVLTWNPPGGFPDFDLETPRGVSWGVSLWTTLPVHTVCLQGSGMYSALHINSPFARFIKLDVTLAWLNIKFSSMAHLKQLSANFHLTIQKSQKSQGY